MSGFILKNTWFDPNLVEFHDIALEMTNVININHWTRLKLAHGATPLLES